MSIEQVITISPSGAITTLRTKGGVDIRSLGKVEIQRISEIVWDEEAQRWKVVFLHGRWANTSLSLSYLCDLFKSGFRNGVLPDYDVDAPSGTLYFTDYEDGVTAEVAVINHLRFVGDGHLVNPTISG